jgi:hypothetical protein
MTAPPRRVAWIIPPPESCCLCKEPLTRRDETSSWNGSPAHRECVRVHLIKRDPAFREGTPTDVGAEEADSPGDATVNRDDEDADFG